MKSYKKIFSILIIVCFLNMSLSMRTRRTITNNNDNAGGTISNNNDAASGTGNITNNNGAPAGSAGAITNNNGAPAGSAGGITNNNGGSATMTNAAPSGAAITNNNGASATPPVTASAPAEAQASFEPQASVAAPAFSKDAILAVKGYASRFLKSDELRIRVYFQDQSNALGDGLTELQQQSQRFRKALNQLGIKDEYILDQSNVDGGMVVNENMLPPFMRSGNNINNNNNNVSGGNNVNNNNNNISGGGNNVNNNNNNVGDYGPSDFYRFSSSFLIILRDFKMANEVVRACKMANGIVEDIFFTVSDELASKEKSSLLQEALNDAIRQANKFSADAGFTIENVYRMNVIDFSLDNMRIWMNLEVEFQV
jgi:uncharacterized protein YggE